jgi:hypothetical protein
MALMGKRTALAAITIQAEIVRRRNRGARGEVASTDWEGVIAVEPT